MACMIVIKRRPIVGPSMADVQRPSKVGILGGTGWPSTVHYHTELCRRSEALWQHNGRVPIAPLRCTGCRLPFQIEKLIMQLKRERPSRRN
jgi:hypothetical protein